MDVNKILSADILDIIFEGRNKEYGAYDLRKTYNKRILISIAVVMALALMIFVGSLLANSVGANQSKKLEVKDVELEAVKEEKKNEPPPPPPPPKMPEPPKVEIAKFTPPKIVEDKEVKEDEQPPEVEKIEEAKI
ncbi:MAG: energy transducer TonB, partial [Bacteroidetes bacterium]